MFKYLKIRQTERFLIFLAIITVAFGFYLVFKAIPPGSEFFIRYPLIIAVMFIITHIILCFVRRDADETILPLITFMSGLGLILIYRIEPSLALKQFIWMTVSIVSMWITVIVLRKYNFLEKYTYLWALTGIFLLIITIMFGTEVNGAKLWIKLGAINFQPVEIVKFMLVLFLANYLSAHQKLLVARSNVPGWWRINIRYFIPLIIIWTLSLLILIFQRDLGMALLLFGIFITMFYTATGRGDYCLAGMIMFFLGAYGCYCKFTHFQIRVSSWLNPWIDMENRGYQITQGLMAIGSGGIWGKGPGLGEPTWIPAVETDFIFSAIGEELGLLGSTAVLICYMILIGRSITMAMKSKNMFRKILITGITAVFTVQTWVIVGGVIKLIPMTGITLPFISYGGSSLLSNFIALGILLGLRETSKYDYT